MFTRLRLTRWTKALRANPEQQISDRLTSDGATGFCCLGKLCQVEGIPATVAFAIGRITYDNAYHYLPSGLGLEFGDDRGNFEKLRMPDLHGAKSAATANDEGISWIEIADHFDKYYPCSDEQ